MFLCPSYFLCKLLIMDDKYARAIGYVFIQDLRFVSLFLHGKMPAQITK